MDSEELARYFEALLSRTEFYDWLGFEPVAVEPGRVVSELPFEDRLTTPASQSRGAVHGGVLATLVDVTAVGAVLSAVDDPRAVDVSTTELDVEFREPARERVRAEAVVGAIDDRTASVAVDVVRAERPGGAPIATGSVACHLDRG